jgi:hypothetical protein
MSHGTLRANAERMRGKENAIRHALKGADAAKDAHLANKVTAKAGDLWHQGPITCDRVAAIVEEQHETKKRDREAKEARRQETGRKRKKRANDAESFTAQAFADIASLQTVWPNSYTVADLKLMTQHLIPNAKGIYTSAREPLIVRLESVDAMAVAIRAAATARAQRELDQARHARRQKAARPGSVNDRPPPAVDPLPHGGRGGRGGRGRGRGRERGNASSAADAALAPL